MKCAYHPQNDAVTQCTECKRPLCEICGRPEAGSTVLCTRCAAVAAARDAAAVQNERRDLHHEKELAASAEKKRKSRLTMVILLGVVAVGIAANLYMYFSETAPKVTEFDPYGDLFLTATLINEGIEAYSADHGGEVPRSLDALSAEYVPYDQITPAVMAQFSYIRYDQRSYELRLKDSAHDEFPDVVFHQRVRP